MRGNSRRAVLWALAAIGAVVVFVVARSAIEVGGADVASLATHSPRQTSLMLER